MPAFLVLSIRLHEGRYHGSGCWPPAPARAFQAMVAGAGISGPLSLEQTTALEWLEAECPPPSIAAPFVTSGQAVGNFVPNNDLDARGGDPRNIGAIRTKKQIRPRLFNQDIPIHYAWEVLSDDESDQHLQILRKLADGLYQLGRGVDFAWATADVMDRDEVGILIAEYPGAIHKPTPGRSGGQVLECPLAGSLASLQDRYEANGRRFETITSGRIVSQSFRQLPKARFRPVAYDCPPVRRLFELRHSEDAERFVPWPLTGAPHLVKSTRDQAAQRLAAAFPTMQVEIDRWLIGRKADGSNGGSPDQRIRLIPLPSVDHQHSDFAIRRLLVELPAGCPFSSADVNWAFSGLRITSAGTELILTSTTDHSMFDRYLAKEGMTLWRSITPVALPSGAARRRIDPSRRVAEAKGFSEKRAEQARAAGALMNTLRHANVQVPVAEIAVQREPFSGHGERVEGFAEYTRFAKERLWHVEIRFSEPCNGPLVLGDGRFCGLGIMVPIC